MKKNHELVIFENGEISLRDLVAGETMHSKIGPKEEANSIYVEQSGLRARLIRSEGAHGQMIKKEELQVSSITSPTLVVFDIGLGLAANSLAALQCRQQLVASGERVRKLKIVSFENDLGGLALALESPERFPFFKGSEEALHALLSQGGWIAPDGEVSWELRVGDFKHWVEAGFGEGVRPEVIFYDFYSPKSQPELWCVDYFAALRRAAAPEAVLVTYSVATSVRVAMLLGGFVVGHGIQTHAKMETTVAACRVEDLAQPLGADWLKKLRRSSKILPLGFKEGDRERVLARVLESGQFPAEERPPAGD